MPVPLVALALLLPRTSDPRQRLEQLATDYGIKIHVQDRTAEVQRNGYTIAAAPVNNLILERYVPIFEQEWRRYPVSLMPKVGLKMVVIGRNVRVKGESRAAVPDFASGWFWVDAEVGQRLPLYGRHVIHHDFFHLIDERDTTDGRNDRTWETLNPAEVRYGKGGWFMQTGDVGKLRNDLPGFLTEYATSAVEEDKAEVYAHLIGSPAFVRRCAATDTVLAAKVDRIKALVKAFEPTMDEAWWARQK